MYSAQFLLEKVFPRLNLGQHSSKKNLIMKLSLKQSLLLAAACTSLSIINAKAVTIGTAFQIPGPGMDLPKNGSGSGGGNGANAVDDFFRVQTEVTAYDNLNPLTPLPTPINQTVQAALTMGEGSTTISVMGFDYIALHYGVGPGGNQATGGGIEVFFLNGANNFFIPDNGSGPNGTGGFSGGFLFQGTPSSVPTPEGGTTALFMGLALLILGTARRFVRATS
jgi:hypothetical protein